MVGKQGTARQRLQHEPEARTVWNHPSLSLRWYVCEPKKSRCACWVGRVWVVVSEGVRRWCLGLQEEGTSKVGGCQCWGLVQLFPG